MIALTKSSNMKTPISTFLPIPIMIQAVWFIIVNGLTPQGPLQDKDSVKITTFPSLRQGRKLVGQSHHAPSILVEVAIVCDKEFGDVYKHNRIKILDFWTSYFWDTSARFTTLISTSIKFHVTSVTAIEHIQEQPFIESARNNVTRKISHDRVMPLFQKYMYQKMNELPQFDIAILATKADIEWRGGQAYFGGACTVDHHGKRFLGCMVMDGNLGSGSHEIGHLLRAPHDDAGPCSHQHAKYIMYKELNLAAQTFSRCSDDSILRFVTSEDAKCLMEAETSPILDPDFDNVMPPSILGQCQQLSTYSLAKVKQLDLKNTCGVWGCKTGVKKETLFAPVGNTICGDGKRCFLGKCVQSGFRLVNVGSGQCISLWWSGVKGYPVPCPAPSTPRDHFFLDGNEEHGMLLVTAAPHLIFMDRYEHICAMVEAQGESDVQQIVTFELCKKFAFSDNDSVARWDIIYVDNEEFMLVHKISRKCARVFLDSIWVDPQCNKNSSAFRWKSELTFPTPGMCSHENKCETSLSKETFFYENKTEQILVVKVNLLCEKGVAVKPAVVISWNDNVKLINVPRNCFPMKRNVSVTVIKCKVGRLLKENESVQVALLHFNISNLNRNESIDFTELLGLLVTPTSASKIILSKKYSPQVWAVLFIVTNAAVTFALILCVYLVYTCGEKCTCHLFGRHPTRNRQDLSDSIVADRNNNSDTPSLEEVRLTEDS